ncbi:sulfotransferase [Kamptonema formosum]|uniref:sulfotransferase n=1 Tax=Kamptonema formosum TaxID=331992 RepID=UPI000348AFA3|nr:sulfotransferase [Oscillatoria sp. PCC 10802]
METPEIQKSTFIVTGMHRSGTSLIASLLQSAGVDLGQRLMQPSHGNVKGHFEDIDFVEFHESVLRSQGISKAGWTFAPQIQVQEQYLETAKLILRERYGKAIWGWKDPRTTLFLKFWYQFLPEAKFILIYRSPWEVVDSLYRRGYVDDSVFYSNPNFALKLWGHYSRILLDFYSHFPEQCLLLNLYSITENPIFLVKAIEEKLGVHLKLPAQDIYDASLLHSEVSSSHRPALIKHYFPEAFELYEELNSRAWSLNGLSTFPFSSAAQLPPYVVWALQDWLDVRRWEKQASNLQSEGEQSQSQLQQTQAQLEHFQSQLQQTQAQLEHFQSQLQQTQAKLEHSQSQLQQTQAKLEHSQSQLQQTQAKLEHSQSQLQQTQAKLEHSQSQLQQTQAQLAQSQSQLEQTQAQLAQSQSQLEQTQAQLEHSQSQLEQTQAELARSQSVIAAVQTSKFWKLRTQWFNFKKFVGLVNDV